jgi:hypothetical protein
MNSPAMTDGTDKTEGACRCGECRTEPVPWLHSNRVCAKANTSRGQPPAQSLTIAAKAAD